MSSTYNRFRALHPWLVILPVFIIVPIYFLWNRGIQWHWFSGSLFCFFLFDSLGIEIGVHKLLCHRSFSTLKIWTNVLAFLSIFAGQGSPLLWVAVHMGSHHPYSDTERDIHSPVHGRFYSFIAWYWRANTKKISFLTIREYIGNGFLQFLHQHHSAMLITYWALLLAAGGVKAWVYLGLLPAAMSISMVGLVNSCMHSSGGISDFIFLKYKNYSGDNTYNSLLLGFLTMGLGYHNNHHQHPARSNYGVRWFEVDPSNIIISLIKR